MSKQSVGFVVNTEATKKKHILYLEYLRLVLCVENFACLNRKSLLFSREKINTKVNLLEESDPIDADAIFLLMQAPPVSAVAAIPEGVCDENAVVECQRFDKNCELHDDDDVCEVIVGDKGGDVGEVGTDDELRLDREEP
uniref:Uncharacterized protein n=1 Tax=Glossina pallidipes TaxID=7398 RepID=A0A1A9ZEY8_GLOPL